MQVERYIPPMGSPYAPYVRSIFRVSAASPPPRELILPKGNVDILFNLGGAMCRYKGERFLQSLAGGAGYLVGLHTGAFATEPSDDIHVFGMSLRVETSGAVLRFRPSEITERVVECRHAMPGMGELLEQLQATGDFGRQTALMLRWLDRRIVGHPRGGWIGHACRWLATAPDPRTSAFAAEHGVSPRQVRRRFQAELGIGPAEYVRLNRFVIALDLLPRMATLTEVAHAAKYHDQAHFCRDFKAISTMPPSVYRSRTGVVPGHVFGR